MGMLIRLMFVGCLFGCSQLAQAMPDLKLPFSAGESWKITRLYEDATHKDYKNGPYSDDRYAIDFADPSGCNFTYGRTILAAASGTIQSIQRTEMQTPTTGYGNSIVINHGDGWSTRYAHLSEIDSSVAEHGEKRFVKQGQKIGEAGGTGYVEGSPCTRPGIPVGVLGVHLHFALYHDGSGVKPEPMSGYTEFAVHGQYLSDNTPQSPAINQPAISCVYSGLSQQFCWKSTNAMPVSCTKAVAWILYDYNAQATYNKLASDCATYCTARNSYCKEVSGSMSVGGFGSTSSFNLNINHFWVRDTATQFDLVAGGHTIRTGQTLEIRNQVKAVNGDTHDFMRPGKNRIEVDFWVREDDGDWHFLGREYIQATNLSSGTTHTEHIAYTVPPDVSQASFKVKIDAEDEAYEVNEGDNWSKVTTFTVDNNPSINLIVSVIQLVNTPIPVPPGSGLRAKMALKNIGTTAPSVGIRSSYSYRPLGSVGPWTQIADDGSDPEDLVPNQEHWEEILSAVTVPTIPGGYELRVCVDYQHAVSESNENDNCLVTIFQVGSLPNLVVTYIGIDSWPDTSIQKGKTHYPTMKVRNSGTGLVSVTTRQRYYLSGPATGNVWQEIDGDDTEAGRLCAGCETTESIKKGFTINKKGIHSLKACADSDNRQPELDETDNCLVSAPIMVK